MSERLQTVAILTGLGLLAVLLGAAVAGVTGVTFAIVGIAALALLAPRVPNGWVLRALRARPLGRWSAPQLYELRDVLTTRAGLDAPPSLFVIDDVKPQALTIGERGDAAIIVSTGLLRMLSARELAGVLAHEVSHIAHGDVRLLRFASTLTSATASLARATILVALVGFPLILLGALRFDPVAFVAVVSAPWIAQALLLALSRTREHAADAGAAALTRDPEGLASALARLEAQKRSMWDRMLGLSRPQAPDWLQTHPPTASRIRRLMGGATSRKPHAVAFGRASAPRRARIVVRRAPRTTILRAV